MPGGFARGDEYREQLFGLRYEPFHAFCRHDACFDQQLHPQQALVRFFHDYAHPGDELRLGTRPADCPVIRCDRSSGATKLSGDNARFPPSSAAHETTSQYESPYSSCDASSLQRDAPFGAINNQQFNNCKFDLPAIRHWTSQLRNCHQRLRLHQLAKHVRQNSAVAVVRYFFGRVDARGYVEDF